MTSYEDWTREHLIAKIRLLERQQNTTSNGSGTHGTKKKEEKPFNFNAYAQRKIALKFCYHGWEYNGLAFQTEPTPLPTVEGVLFDALCHARLIDRDTGFEGCDWSRCGRTDRGVSAAGQVIALRVRCSNRPLQIPETGDDSGQQTETEPPIEIRYIQVLNRILPASIRILAWSPVKAGFSARFNCRNRHYKYFFDSLPSPTPPLNISLMQDAARRFIGEHDFRNFCKLDGSKQIESYDRRVISTAISKVDSDDLNAQNPLYVFDLMGSAFLWHQVRHIMAILFLVGQGLESPSIVDALLNAKPDCPNPDTRVPLLENRPLYDMAEGLPLMLWECGFDDVDVQWRTDDNSGSESRLATSSPSTIQLLESMYSSLSSTRIEMSLLRHFSSAAEVYHQAGSDKVVRLQGGGGKIRHINQYVPLLKRRRGQTPAKVNENWRTGRGVVVAARRLAEREVLNNARSNNSGVEKLSS
jgi:tRNA pseudouridine38/39 synthase